MARVKDTVIFAYEDSLECIQECYDGDYKSYFADWCKELARKKQELAQETATFKLVREMYNNFQNMYEEDTRL